MLSLGLLYTLVSAVSWSGFDVTRKRLTASLGSAQLVVLVNLIQVPGFAIWCAIEGVRFEPMYLKHYWVTLTLNLLANLFFLKSVKLSPLSTTVPLLSMTPVCATVIGTLWFAEPVETKQCWGIGCVVLGALLLNATSRDLTRPWRLFTTLVRERATLYMTFVALLWSLAPFFDKRALAHATVGVHAGLLSGGIAVTMALMLVTTGTPLDFAKARHHRGLLALSGGCAIVAFGCQLLAIQWMAVGLFEGLKRALGLALAVVGGRLFFSEPLTGAKLASVFLMGLGVLLLT